MGFWGEGLYENDIALDIRDRLEDGFENADIEELVQEVAAEIQQELDEDEAPVAWLAFADTLFDRGILTDKIRSQAVQAAAFLQDDMLPPKHVVQEIIEKINRPQRKRRKKVVEPKGDSPWKPGDIFIYDFTPENASSPYVSEWNIGFWKIRDTRIGRSLKGSIVYFFRTKHSAEELTADPSLVRNAQFWPIASAWGKSFAYRGILAIEKNGIFPVERIHYCGNHLKYEPLPYEWRGNDPENTEPPVLFSIFFWGTIEEKLLNTAPLLERVPHRMSISQ